MDKKNVNLKWLTVNNNKTSYWIQKVLVLILLALLVNHLASRERLPGSDLYSFPIVGFLASISLSVLGYMIAHFNFQYYKKMYLINKVDLRTIAWFMGSTLAYIAIMYIPANILIDLLLGGVIDFYLLSIGLLITLLVCFIFIVLYYASDFYYLYTSSLKKGGVTIESGAKTTKLLYENIACFYSEHKIVFAVKNDGTILSSDYTLNSLEENLNDQLFFRANRNVVLHKDNVEQIEKIENGKLRVLLKVPIKNETVSSIIISRYKRQPFLEWYR